MSETPKSILPEGRLNHICEHEGCSKVAPFGFNKRYGTEWYCGEHKAEGGKGTVNGWAGFKS
ncbi:hypothetical protein BFS86_19810 [Shewanella algae]|jgi:hypothetical protein|nr:hypothetical protein BFS86_19810 [Shewanella algae]DAQ47168.1 MAG TPA: hypothetical protein [Caudoviricetes sp.]